MKPPRFDYEAPIELQQALQRLAELGDEARPIAGGQSLVPALNLRLANPAHLIDLRRIASLRGIREEGDGTLVIGAMTRHVDVERSALLGERLPLLPAVMARVAHPQIRTRGTLGGSLAHADPAAEWPAVCAVLDASMVLVSARGERQVRAQDFSLGVYSTALEPGELVREVRFPAWPARRRWGFEEVSRRLGDFAITGALCTLDLDPQGRCAAVRCVVFAAAEAPVLIDASSLLGQRPDEAAIAAVARAARAAISPMGDHHASAAYRSELVEVLTARVLQQAVGSRPL